MNEIIIKNGRVITPFRIIEKGGVVVRGRTIKGVFSGDLEANPDLIPEAGLDSIREVNLDSIPEADMDSIREVSLDSIPETDTDSIQGTGLQADRKAEEDCLIIDAQGEYISPGFIDIHVHGGGRGGVMDGSAESIRKMCQVHGKNGTTSILPTTSSGSWEDLYRAIDAVREASKNNTGAGILGIHLEGPYFSPEQKGAQNEEYLYTPDPADYMKLLDYWDKILMMSAAPELPGSLQLGRELRRRGIVAAIGHSNASYRQVIEALENGYSHITHFYSGCSMVHRNRAFREAGVVESGYAFDELTLDIIADGKHLPPSLLRLIYKARGADKIALITDGTAYAGEEVAGEYLEIEEGGRRYIIEDGVMKLSDRSRFAGSVATANRLVYNMITLADVPLLEAVKMATITPARVLGINRRKGYLSRDLDADIIIFDENIDVKMTMVEGKIR